MKGSASHFGEIRATYYALKILIKYHPPSVFNPNNQYLRKHSLMGWFPSRLPISFLNCNSRRYLIYRYDVFLSFRRRELRNNMNRGDVISASLSHAIEESGTFIPTFSTNYAKSVWCLTESSLIARQVQNGSAIAIPLFYNVTPSQVRRPDQCGGPFAEAFEERERSGIYSAQEIVEWKADLFKLCCLSGLSL